MEKSFILKGSESIVKLPKRSTMGQYLYDQLVSAGTKIAEVKFIQAVLLDNSLINNVSFKFQNFF
jgi:hypothetical protein